MAIIFARPQLLNGLGTNKQTTIPAKNHRIDIDITPLLLFEKLIPLPL